MPTGQITDALGANGEPVANGAFEIVAVNGDSVSLAVGTLVEIVTPFANTGTFQVKRSSTTADFLLVGVVVGGTTPGQSAAVGGPVTVVTEGKVQITMDDTGGGTTAGDVIVQSTITAGQGKDNGSTAVSGKTIGTVLQTVTIASGSALVWAWIHRI